MTVNPIISVYLPTRNRARLFSEAVQSVLAQSEKNLELIIVDDGSTDETPEICKEIEKHDPRVIVVRQCASVGAAVARNIAISLAQGVFITGIDDDDLMLPRRLESFLKNWSSYDSFLCSSFWLMRPSFSKYRLLNSGERCIGLQDLLYQNLVGNQLFTRTSFVLEVGGFDERFVASQDYDLWTRLACRFGPGRRIDEATYVMRQGVASSSISASSHFSQGARQYTAKHFHLMSAAQRRSQRLLHQITARQRVAISDWPTFWALPTAGLFLRYWLSQFGWVSRIRNFVG